MKEQRHIIFQGLSHSGIQSVHKSKAAPGWLGLIYFTVLPGPQQSDPRLGDHSRVKSVNGNTSALCRAAVTG